MFEFIGLVFIQAFLIVAASAMSAVCVLITYRCTRRIPPSRSKRRALITAVLFPFVAVFYLEGGLFLQAVVQHAQGKDNFLDGLYHYPLANGYRLTFFDENPPDQGDLEHDSGRRLEGVGRVRAVQAIGDYLFVVADPDVPAAGTVPTVTVVQQGAPPVDVTGTKGEPVTQYLEVDTQTSQVKVHATLNDLAAAAGRQGTSLQLISLEEACLRARSAAAPGLVFLGLVFTPLLIAVAWLLRNLRRIRKDAAP